MNRLGEFHRDGCVTLCRLCGRPRGGVERCDDEGCFLDMLQDLFHVLSSKRERGRL